MGNALIRASVAGLEVLFNGDRGDDQLRLEIEAKKKRLGKKIKRVQGKLEEARKKGDDEKESRLERRLQELGSKLKTLTPPKDNALAATLTYPRSGSSQVVSVRTFDLESGKAAKLPDTDDFLKSGLFKELVQGETTLQLAVTDKDSRNRFLLFFRTVAASVFGELADDVIDGISEVVVSSTADELSSLVSDKIEGSSDTEKETVVAKSSKVELRIGAAGELTVSNADGKKIRFEDGLLTLALKAPKRLKTKDGSEGQQAEFLEKGAANGSVVLKLCAEPWAS